MTIGEYSQMINGEHWLKNGISCKLTIIPCSYYNRKCNTIPAYKTITIPNDKSINLYLACAFEGTNVSVGRGTEKQFQIYGSPYLPQSNFSFVQTQYNNPVYNGVACFGRFIE
jgi:uncharacterized protein YbbC (DUF1343 family)